MCCNVNYIYCFTVSNSMAPNTNTTTTSMVSTSDITTVTPTTSMVSTSDTDTVTPTTSIIPAPGNFVTISA